MIVPHKRPIAALVDEGPGEDQSLLGVALIPSEAYLTKMLSEAGFPAVYRVVELPDHEDFRATILHHMRRTVLVASKVNLEHPLLRRVSEELITESTWHGRFEIRNKTVRLILSKILLFLRLSPREKLWTVRRLLPYLPVPIVLDFGCLWLAWNDALSRLLFLGMPFEKPERDFLNRFLAHRMIVLDIGAHHGFYTLLASRKVGPHGLVVAFEPSPREIQRLKWNLIINRCSNVRVESVAISGREGVSDFFVCLGRETGFNSLRPPDVQEPTRRITVRTTTLDGYLYQRRIQTVDFVKIDAEGGELEILKGGTATLNSNSPPVIMCEVQDIRTRPWGPCS